MECEFGGTLPVRFLDPSSVKMYDSDGKEVLCKCGESASEGIIGKNASLARCNKCMGYEDSPYKLVYRPPNESR